MPKRHVFVVFAALIVIFSVILCSCSSKSAIGAADAEKLYELADILGVDIKEKILPKRTTPDDLVEYDYVISGKNHSAGTEALAIFFADYKEKKDCEVTFIFTNGSFVVSRVTFIDGKGYYLRYEYDEKNPKSLPVRGQAVTRVDLQHKSSSGWEMLLFDGKRQRALFTIESEIE